MEQQQKRALAKTFLKAAKGIEKKGWVAGIRHAPYGYTPSHRAIIQGGAKWADAGPDAGRVGAMCALGALEYAGVLNPNAGNSEAVKVLADLLKLPVCTLKGAYNNAASGSRVADWSNFNGKQAVINGFKCAAKRLLRPSEED